MGAHRAAAKRVRVVGCTTMRWSFARGGACLSVAGLLCGLVAGCSSPGNTGRREISKELLAQVPWLNGAEALRDENGAVLLPAEPIYPPIGSNRPDPGSGPVDCS